MKKNKRIGIYLGAAIIILAVSGILVAMLVNRGIFISKEKPFTPRPPFSLQIHQKESLIAWLKENPELSLKEDRELVFCYAPVFDQPQIYFDLVEVMERGLDIKIKIRIITFDQGVPMVKSGECDAFLEATPTKEREELIAFTKIVYLDEAIGVNKNDTELLKLLNSIIDELKRIKSSGLDWEKRTRDLSGLNIWDKIFKNLLYS